MHFVFWKYACVSCWWCKIVLGVFLPQAIFQSSKMLTDLLVLSLIIKLTNMHACSFVLFHNCLSGGAGNDILYIRVIEILSTFDFDDWHLERADIACASISEKKIIEKRNLYT